jgi:hypothetical protein
MANVKIIFSIYGDTLDPLFINELTDINNSIYWYKGDIIENRKILRKETAWEYTLNMTNIAHFEEIGNIFLNKFIDKVSQLKQYILQHKLESKIDIVIEIINKETPSLYFSQDFINFSSSLGCKIDIDLYILD